MKTFLIIATILVDRIDRGNNDIDFIITNIVRRVNSSSNDEAKHRFTIDQSLESKKIISLEIYEIENIKYVI